MPNFIYDNTALYTNKVNTRAVGPDPTLEFKDVDANLLKQSLLDIQTVLLGGMKVYKTGALTTLADLKVYNGTPNGVITALKGSICFDVTTPALYQNTDGGTAWAVIGGGGGLTSPLGSSVVIQSPRYQITGPVTLGSGPLSNLDLFSGGTPTEIVLVTPATGGTIIDGLLAQGNGSAPINGAKLTIVHSAINHDQIIFKNFEGSASAAANTLYINSESNISGSGFSIGHRQSVTFIYNTDRGKWMPIGGSDGRFRKLGLGYEILDTGLAAANHNYAPVGIEYTSRLRLAGTNSTITGIKGQSHGDLLWISNYSSTSLTLTHNDALSVAGNKFLLPSSTSVVIPPYGSVQLIYDSGNSAWLLAAKGY